MNYYHHGISLFLQFACFYIVFFGMGACLPSSQPPPSSSQQPILPPSISPPLKQNNITQEVDNEYTILEASIILDCNAEKSQLPKLFWISPNKDILPNFNNNATDDQHLLSDSTRLKVLNNGSLLISKVSQKDLGIYRCVAEYSNKNITHFVHLGLDRRIFSEVRNMSIFVGICTCVSFLLFTLIGQFVRFILDRLGITCNAAQKSKRLRAFFDSMEQNKTSQLDWLRDNYYMQAKRIKENCISQLEKIRESYSSQANNLVGIKEYGTQQIQGIRDQYHDQVRKVASYSGHQLCKVRENYLFQRNRVCKFSSHQLLKIRETYKWQAQTLNKILENLPKTLNFDTCRGIGACGRSDSMYLDDIDESDMPLDGELKEERELHKSRKRNELGDGQFHYDKNKQEHISLLIPPEFMSSFINIKDRNASSSSSAPKQILDVRELHSLLDDNEDEYRIKIKRECHHHHHHHHHHHEHEQDDQSENEGDEENGEKIHVHESRVLSDEEIDQIKVDNIV